MLNCFVDSTRSAGRQRLSNYVSIKLTERKEPQFGQLVLRMKKSVISLFTTCSILQIVNVDLSRLFIVIKS